MPSSGSMTSLSASSISSKRAGLSVETMPLAYVRRGQKAIVSLVFEAVGEFGATLLGDTAVDEYVHEIGLDVAQDPRVVRDEQQAKAGALLGAVDAFRHCFQRVHVEPGVRLVEHGEPGLEEFK